MEKNIKLKINGMDCASCVGDIEKIFKKSKGIEISVSFVTQTALVTYDDSKWNEEQIKDSIRKIGYEVE